jgi:hypothetical protein
MSKRLTGMVCNGKWKATKQKFINFGTKFKPVKKTKFVCEGGVLHGHKLFLTTNGTMPFSIRGVKGYYDNAMRWVALT